MVLPVRCDRHKTQFPPQRLVESPRNEKVNNVAVRLAQSDQNRCMKKLGYIDTH